MRPDRLATLSSAMGDFVGQLRAAGLAAAPAEVIEAVRALEAIDLADRDDLYHALRAIFVRQPEMLPLFNREFIAFWGPKIPRSSSDPAEEPTPPSPVLMALGAAERQALPGPIQHATSPIRIPGAGAGDDQDLLHKDVAQYDAAELARARRLIARLAPRLATRPSRRYRPTAAATGRVDARRTVRTMVAAGGEPHRIAWRTRRIRRTRLVILGDVSGSMDPYSRLLIEFLFGCRQPSLRVSAFVFATRLTAIDAYLRRRTPEAGLAAVAAAVPDWGGGTNIAASLATFNRAHAPALLNGQAVVIILSDGWDRGDPARLAAEMQALRARARRVLWLNPLLANPGYAPLCRGMQAALPYIDYLLPAHDLASLLALTRHLGQL